MKIPESKYTDLLGKPFKIGGRGRFCSCGRLYADREVPGCDLCSGKFVGAVCYDCYGLAMEVCQRNNILLPEHTSVCEPALMTEAIEQGKSDFTEVPGPTPFCLVVFRLAGPCTTHIGVILEDPRGFIHTLPGRTVTIERLRRWERKVDGYRYSRR